MAKARTKDSMRAFRKLTHEVDGELRIISDPPVIVPIDELVDEAERGEVEGRVRDVLEQYRITLSDHHRHLLDSYHYVHAAMKVVGVGSVGTRAWIVLMLGRDGQDPLFLQVKEAQESVLEPYAAPSQFDHHGERVVKGQQLMQAASDIFLGWVTVTGIDGESRDFYVRQLWDWKGSAQVELMSPRGMAAYGQICGATLARAHARSGDRIAISAYLGSQRSFDRAIAEFAERLRRSERARLRGSHGRGRRRSDRGRARDRLASRAVLEQRPAGAGHLGRGALHRRRRVARVALEPAGVAVGQGSGGEAVGEDRETDGQVDREDDQVLVGELGLLDHDQREHDRGQAAGSEPPEEADRGHLSVGAQHPDRHGHHPHDREAEDRVEGELPGQLTQGRSDRIAPKRMKVTPLSTPPTSSVSRLTSSGSRLITARKTRPATKAAMKPDPWRATAVP